MQARTHAHTHTHTHIGKQQCNEGYAYAIHMSPWRPVHIILCVLSVNFLRRTMYSCFRDSKHRSFCAFVLPILEYACQAWNPHTQKCVKQLESIQCRGAKWVCGAQYNSSNFTWTPSSAQCCALLKWPPLFDCRKFCIIQTLHDILHQCICIIAISLYRLLVLGHIHYLFL